MTSWYYVQGTERMGPVDEKDLHNIFKQGSLQKDSYVWTKGFANWERLHDVADLKYFLEEDVAPLEKKESPEVQFYFDWKNIRVNDEIFFILTGKDRLQKEEEILGPYSLQELHSAFEQKRINEQTLIYTPGMLYWERIGAIPTIQDQWKLKDHVPSSDTKSPGLVAIDRQPIPVTGVIKIVADDTVTILCGQHFLEGDDLFASLYKKEDLKAKNIKLKVIKINRFQQTVECDITNLDDENKKIMHECV